MNSLLVVLALLVCGVWSKAPLLGGENPSKIDGQFIVLYHQNVTEEEAQTHRTKVDAANILFTYSIGKSFKGFAAKLDATTVEALRSDAIVSVIHYDGMDSIAQACHQQSNSPSWGLPRVSFSGPPGDTFVDNYRWADQQDGRGVTAYVLDTGIYIDHNDFGGRAAYGANFVDSVATDQHGHGTHCAGTIGGNLYGVAKTTSLVAVKVLGRTGSGATSGVIAGINWAAQQHQSSGGPSIISMSLGSTTDGGKNAACDAAVETGVVVVVAAGNSNSDACFFYPASAKLAISVAASTLAETDSRQVDTRASFSNYGACVELFAPGTAIVSCGISSPSSSAIMSGTSMACPHVAGYAAVVLSASPQLSPADVLAKIIADSQKGLVGDPVGTINALLHNPTCAI